ncbi:MAG: phosphatase PAP2 family protein [Armatimonadia bacterium]
MDSSIQTFLSRLRSRLTCGRCLWLLLALSLPLVHLALDPLTEPARQAMLRVPGLGWVMEVVRCFGKFETQTAMLLTAFLVMWLARWKPAKRWLLVTVLALLATAIATNGLKLIVRRERPKPVSSQITTTNEIQDIATGKRMSFPSGDTASAFAIALVLGAFVPSLGPWSVLMACLVGVSRVYFGCHYWADVLGGALVGVAMTVLVLRSARRRGWLPEPR